LVRLFNILVLVFLGQFFAVQSAMSDDGRFDGIDRVVAIADIHGAYDAMVETLQKVDVLGDDLGWTGDQTHLVIVGDILDRGPKSRAAMDLLMRLEGEAEASGGRVHVLIGNHEAMLLQGDMRYVSAAEYAAFAAEEVAEERTHWFELYVERQDAVAKELRQQFDKKFPPGYFAMRRAFRADGEYGHWLLQKNIIAVINGTAFVHGGLSPMIREYGLDGINNKLQRELVGYIERLAVLTDAAVLLPTDSHYEYQSLLENYMPALNDSPDTLSAIEEGIRLGSARVVDMDGPLWYRNNVMCPGIVEEHRLDAALAAIGADRVVIGHTPTPNREVVQRFGGRVIEIDTGMLNFYYKGTGHALVIEGDNLSITNQLGVDSLVPLPQQRDVGQRPGKLTAGALQELLEQGDIVSVETKLVHLSHRQTMVRVTNGEQTVSAVFKKSKDRDVYPGVAAFRLDELLQLEMVPVTVKREVEGDVGSLQFLPGNIINEADRSASGQGGGAWCSLADQWPAMYVFDVLIYNEARSQQRILYDQSSWRLILSENDRTFATKKGRPKRLRDMDLLIGAGWKAALSELTDDVLEENFGDVLDKRRMDALRKRRDSLLAIN
jgi:hypothetical protein